MFLQVLVFALTVIHINHYMSGNHLTYIISRVILNYFRNDNYNFSIFYNISVLKDQKENRKEDKINNID